MIPRTNWTARRLPALVQAAVAADTVDQSMAAVGKYRPGRTRVINMFEGNCAIIYPTVKTATAV